MIRRPPRSTLFPTRRSSDLQARSQAGALKHGEWKPWFPVIDYDRCTNCMQCLSFCLFGVYGVEDRKSTRLNSSHGYISYAVFCLKKKKNKAVHNTIKYSSE